MYDLIIFKQKLNKLKIAIIISIIVLLIIGILMTIKIYNKKRALASVNEYGEWVDKVNEAEQKQKQEIEKYKPLSEEELQNINTIYKHQDNKRVFLTFDDGPTQAVTPYILDLLNQENIKATFFVLGSRVEVNPELIKREYEEGHFIANHGYTHKYSEIYASPQSVLDEYNATNNAIKNALQNQNYNSLVFRFPGGSSGGKYFEIKNEAKELLKQNGIASLDWNALTNDAAGANTREKIMENFYATVKDKTSIVILMHDASDKILTYECLPEIIQYFKDNEYSFKTLQDVIQR